MDEHRDPGELLIRPLGWGRFGVGSPEREMLLALGTVLGCSLRPHSIAVDDARVEIEGLDEHRRTLVQLVANRGMYRPAFRNKVLADLFKLGWLRQRVPEAHRAVLLVTPTVLPALGGWVPRAATDCGVTVLVAHPDGRIAGLDCDLDP